MDLKDIGAYVAPSTYGLLERADRRCRDALSSASGFLGKFLINAEIPPDKVCLAVAGSYGRYEALEASDFDLTPVAADEHSRDAILKQNDALRKGLALHLGVDVSQGRDLTKAVALPDLTAAEKIGGEQDGRAELTRRILILTEAAAAGGDLGLESVRKAILDAYASERTAGRHPLAFCNDVARYYRTVCIDYKARVDTTAKDWCSRNVKLRHSRKFWYFATLLSVSSLASSVRPDRPEFIEEILRILDLPPYLRLMLGAGPAAVFAAGRVLDQYAWYLDFMADPERRAALAKVKHERRYEVGGGNPYPALQWNAKMMHSSMIGVLEQVDRETRQRVLDWFLL